jgi:hypothetical protein
MLKRSGSPTASRKRLKQDESIADSIIVPDELEADLDKDEQEAVANAPIPNANKISKREIRKLKALLEKAHKDAPKATKNPHIGIVAPEDWGKVTYEDERSLAEWLHLEEGWSADYLVDTVIGSSHPFLIHPLDRKESRALWKAIRYRHKLQSLEDSAIIDIDLPESWLDLKIELNSKIFQKEGWH